MADTKTTTPLPAFRRLETPTEAEAALRQGGLRWGGVAELSYKEDETTPFRAVTRQVLFQSPELAGEWRYFEVAPGGYSTLERHEHAHGVMILSGRGRALVGDAVRAVAPFDLVAIPGWTWHQFRADQDAPLGFLCLVNVIRDKPVLPDAADLANLRRNPEIAAFLGLSQQ
jgi:quercetin dioxygenase-like cupin family protein